MSRGRRRYLAAVGCVTLAASVLLLAAGDAMLGALCLCFPARCASLRRLTP